MPDTMMCNPHTQMIFDRLASRGQESLLATEAGDISADAVLQMAGALERVLRDAGVAPASICAFQGDYSPSTVALFLALIRIGAISVPFSAGVSSEKDELADTANVEFWIDPVATTVTHCQARAERHELVAHLAREGHAGLIVFTSGSTGKPKAILHDVEKVASKFVQKRPGWRMVLFLLMDHFGGFNTLLSVFAHGGVGICIDDRSPKSVCRAISACKAELLPTTPTFLGMLIVSGLWREYDLSSIRLVTYGAEPMPATTLSRMREILPRAEFKQTYGLSELGVLRSNSPDQGSLWLKIGGEGFETRVVNGQLHVRSGSTMLGYLNAPSPIDADGWMNTGDLVVEKDGLIRFLGRRNEIINVGGQKVLPIEVEEVLLDAPGVSTAMAYGVPHSVTGQAVVARVALDVCEDPKALSVRLREHCRNRLQKYKVPMRFEIVDESAFVTSRGKKNRLRHADKEMTDE